MKVLSRSIAMNFLAGHALFMEGRLVTAEILPA
jgi:hypothetical protein